MRGYAVVFGDRHVCYWMYISSAESDFPYARGRLNAIIKGIELGGTYPALVDELPLELELDEERIPLILTSIAEDPLPAASLRRDDTGLGIHVSVMRADTSSQAAALARALGDDKTRTVSEEAEWVSSQREVIDSLVEIRQAAVRDDSGDWIHTILTWSLDTEVFVILYSRFDFEYDDSHIKQIVTGLEDDD